MDQFPIIELPDDALELPEALGTKTKYWVRHDGCRQLFKIGRPGTGENWAEKVAAELAGLLGLPHAKYELARHKDSKGVLSPTILPKGGRLVMGNELLADAHADYPAQREWGVSDHTIGRIHTLMIQSTVYLPIDWASPHPDIERAFDLFVGYLLLDAWIANQDRHHENWAFIVYNGGIHLAPTYDHAASLGQNENDENRSKRLTTQDKGHHISSYVTKARSALYQYKGDKKPLLLMDAFLKAAERRPLAATAWINRLREIQLSDCRRIFEQMPPEEISGTAIEFALQMLELNQQRLLQETPTP